MGLNEWITLVATKRDVALLAAIAKEDGDGSKSATVRRLIRDEARRRQIEVDESEQATRVSEPA